MAELEKRRLEIGISGERLSEVAGCADRSYAKMIHANTASGRMARWATVQTVMDVLFCDGFKLTIEPCRGPEHSELCMRHRIGSWRATFDPAERRRRMRELGRQGGTARARALSPKRREAIARRAAKARWRRHAQRAAGAESC